MQQSGRPICKEVEDNEHYNADRSQSRSHGSESSFKADSLHFHIGSGQDAQGGPLPPLLRGFAAEAWQVSGFTPN